MKCFECKKEIKKENSDDYLCLDKWIEVCLECRKKFSDFAVKQAKAKREHTNWYDAKFKGKYKKLI